MDTCNYNNVLMRDRIQQKNHVRRLNEMVCYRKKASNDSKFFTECDPVDLYVEKVTLQNLIWTFICRSRNLGTRLRFETTAETQSNEGFLLTFSLKIPFIESVKLIRQKKISSSSNELQDPFLFFVKRQSWFKSRTPSLVVKSLFITLGNFSS